MTTTPAPISDMNPTGVASFEHPTELVGMPEYRAAQQSLRALADASIAADIDMGCDQFALVIAEMLAALPFGDGCDDCMDDPTVDFGTADWIMSPHAAEVDNGWVTATYRCSTHQRQWACGYALSVGAWT